MKPAGVSAVPLKGLHVRHRWREPLPDAGYQLLFSPGGPGGVGLHIGFVHRETPQSPPQAFGCYPVGHEPGGDNTRLKLRLLFGASAPAYICTKPTQMSDQTVYVDLNLDRAETDRLHDSIQRSVGGGGRPTIPSYHFYKSNCAHWVARTLHDAAGFPVRCEGILSARSVFAQTHRHLAQERPVS